MIDTKKTTKKGDILGGSIYASKKLILTSKNTNEILNIKNDRL